MKREWFKGYKQGRGWLEYPTPMRRHATTPLGDLLYNAFLGLVMLSAVIMAFVAAFKGW